MHWPYIPSSLQAQPHAADLFGYTAPVSQRKRLTGGESPEEAVTSRDTCSSERGVFSSEPKTSARPCMARADSLAARAGEPQGSPVLPRSLNPVRAASRLRAGSAALHNRNRKHAPCRKPSSPWNSTANPSSPS